MSLTNKSEFISTLSQLDILTNFENYSVNSSIQVIYGVGKCIEDLCDFINKNLPSCSAKLKLRKIDLSIDKMTNSTFDETEGTIVNKLIRSLLESKNFNKIIEQHLLDHYNYSLFEQELTKTIEYHYKKTITSMEVESLKEELKTNSNGIIKPSKI
jgi:hypothetical protein